jgi:prepilin-type N-terminal cleavage/methylation domain-containing protein
MKNSLKGFSLFELLITIIIISIIFTLSLQGLTAFSSHEKEKLLQARVKASLEFARQEALTLRVSIGVCGYKESRCVNTPANILLFFRDSGEDGVIYNDKQILKRLSVNDTEGVFYLRTYPIYHKYLMMRPQILNGNDNGTIWYCHRKSLQPAWALILSKTGNIRSVLPNKRGALKDAEGRVLSC